MKTKWKNLDKIAPRRPQKAPQYSMQRLFPERPISFFSTKPPLKHENAWKTREKRIENAWKRIKTREKRIENAWTRMKNAWETHRKRMKTH